MYVLLCMLSNEQINGTDLLVGGASVLLIISSGVRFNRFPSGWAQPYIGKMAMLTCRLEIEEWLDKQEDQNKCYGIWQRDMM